MTNYLLVDPNCGTAEVIREQEMTASEATQRNDILRNEQCDNRWIIDRDDEVNESTWDINRNLNS